MRIKEAEIFSFGKFQSAKFQFAPGVNVIYGANEAGKSTLHAFLVGMLFGMEKGRGKSAVREGYQRYEPWHAPAYYSGALRFEVEGRPFYLERNFYHREKRDFLRNEADGEELSVAYGDLSMLLGGIQKETFGNTYDISQSGAVTGKELAGALAEYLSDAAESGDASFRVSRAVEKLRYKEKKLNAELREVFEKKNALIHELEIERDILERDCVKLREDMVAVECQIRDSEAKRAEAMNSVPMEREQNSNTAKVKKSIIGFVAAAILVVAMFGHAYMSTASGGEFFGTIQIGLGMLAFAIAAMSVTSFIRSTRQRDAADACGESGLQGKIAPQSEHVLEVLGVLKDSLGEKETRLYNIRVQLAELKNAGEQERELEQQIAAAKLAADEIQRLAQEFCEEASDRLNSDVSYYISAITDGRYDSVRVDENGKLWVLVDGKEIPPDALSRGTLEQFHLALRLAVGKMVTQDEQMPIFLDDAFALYDDKRLAQVLKVLSNMKEQVLLFTCQRREMEQLEAMGIAYHAIRLEE